MQYLHNIDMRQNELQNAVIQPLPSAPANPKIGQLYTDVSGNEPKIKWWNGKKWVDMGSSAAEKAPSVVQPSVSISLENLDASNMEVGSTVALSYSATFNPGSYTYGPDTGVSVVSWKIYDNSEDTEVYTTPTGTFADVTVVDKTDYQIIVEAEHTAGAIPVGDQGTQYPSSQILAGTKSATTKSVTGIRKYFYGTSSEIKSLTSDYIRSLTHSTRAIGSGDSFDLKINEGTNQVIIAFPTDSGLSLTSVVDTGAFNIEVYDIFDKSVVSVEGANGYEAINYDVYVYTPDISLGANKYKVTIS